MVTASSAVCCKRSGDCIEDQRRGSRGVGSRYGQRDLLRRSRSQREARRHGYHSARQAAQRDIDRSGKAIDRGRRKSHLAGTPSRCEGNRRGSHGEREVRRLRRYHGRAQSQRQLEIVR